MAISDDSVNALLDALLELHPKKIDLSLDRSFALLNKLGNPQDKIENIIHFAGTNGKFSTLNFVKEILKNNPSKMYLVEKDTFLAENLQEIIDERVKIFNEDILKFDENLLSKNKIIVFGNLPYNVSTEILSTWITKLKNDYWFSDLILMFQKEMAERVIGNFGSPKYGRLSILRNYRLKISDKFNISSNCFLSNNFENLLPNSGWFNRK